ncbi:DNA cytosine methyltransferase [Rhodosalinus sp. K401]|uniref:DNA cytosine methyltransferase n=1 Tax=Rhodosalinus sp. K401 TaxID=3239195 RepID=UPI0035238B55
MSTDVALDAGKRRGADDPRHLWPHVARIVGDVEPSFVFLENVAHHLRLGFPEVAG